MWLDCCAECPLPICVHLRADCIAFVRLVSTSSDSTYIHTTAHLRLTAAILHFLLEWTSESQNLSYEWLIVIQTKTLLCRQRCQLLQQPVDIPIREYFSVHPQLSNWISTPKWPPAEADSLAALRELQRREVRGQPATSPYPLEPHLRSTGHGGHGNSPSVTACPSAEPLTAYAPQHAPTHSLAPHRIKAGPSCHI